MLKVDQTSNSQKTTYFSLLVDQWTPIVVIDHAMKRHTQNCDIFKTDLWIVTYGRWVYIDSKA